MAAVAAEPGAAAASTTVGDGTEFESEAELQTEATNECASVMDLMHIPKDQDAAPECRLVNAETRDRPEQEAAGKAYIALAEDEQIDAGCPKGNVSDRESEITLKDRGWADLRGECESLKAEFSPVLLEVANEVSPYDSIARLQSAPTPISTPESSVVFLHSHCTPPALGMDGDELAASLLSSVEPVETTTESATCSGSDATTEPTEIVCEVRALIKPLVVTEPESKPIDAASTDLDSTEDAVLKCCEIADHTTSLPVLEREKLLGTAGEKNVRDLINISPRNSSDPATTAVDQLPPVLESEDLHAPQRVCHADSSETLSESKPTVTSAETTGLPPDSIAHLSPGSEVRVSLDHIIDDALVVSFQLGEKIFSGVLMDLSKRFGPYGIPVTVFPRREYRDRPESMQLKMEPFSLGVEKEGEGERDSPDSPPNESSETHVAPTPTPNPNLWTSKPPPLFQEGAPYPPPLFIRDTYSQSIPQPPPRKIKRPKRRLYREEPTSIMSAIRLRPRQVLCDKCKGAVTTGDKREARRGPGSDCTQGRGEEAKRRRGDSTAAGGKRPRSEERARSTEGPKRQAPSGRNSSSSSSCSSSSSSVGQVKGGGGANRVPRGAPGTTAPPVTSNAKKVLQSKNVDHSKACEVLKMAKAQRRQRETVVVAVADAKARTRAAALQDAHQKVHFTRRLHRISGGAVGRLAGSAPLPSRIRIKPQRYRNGKKQSGLPTEQGGGCATLLEPAPSCSFSNRSSCSSGNLDPAVATEIQGCTRKLEPEIRLRPQNKPPPRPQLETDPRVTIGEVQGDLKAESGDQRGLEVRRETRGARADSLMVYATHDPGRPASSNASVCSVNSADDVKSSNSEYSSTENFDFLPPVAVHSVPSTSSPVTMPTSFSSSSREDGKRSKSLKASVFSKTVSKCVALDGTTICAGDIVWAKICGFPWWPARVLAITVSRKDSGLLVGQDVQVSWFGSPTTSFLTLSQLTPFLENFQSRFDKKRKGPYRRAITEAAKAAEQLTPEVRALLTQFET
ncbi:hypothetical protein SKAU_G00269760 [Synaphobranchus kaupii]|uniref:PWWP domain-containing protein n=1 Tax=Synaphobranchus kaupii TaxID=118154 RepID=A0A9Q1F019_SYNKA|nr:hypothetical protein SKAU_G00269760 [Synaphobranchus kaupii]